MKPSFATGDKIAVTSSKGNQEKWLSAGRWYKVDQFGYEGLSEVLASSILSRSNILSDTPFTFVDYKMERMKVHGIERNGCSSKNFNGPDISIITLSRLFGNTVGPLSTKLSELSSDKKRIEYLANKTTEITGLTLFPQYLTLLFECDALFLNDDRHLNNIAVLQTSNGYDYCPIFDNGAGFLSNTQIYPMDISPAGLIKIAKARPFNTTFNRQIRSAASLFGSQLKLPRISESELRTLLAEPLSFYPSRDQGLIADRVVSTFLTRQKHCNC